jgi:hypothetical protein
MLAKSRSIKLVTRLLILLVIGGLFPLTAIAVSALRGYHNASTHAESVTISALDTASLVPIQQRAKQTAENIGDFLDSRASDARAVALLPPDPTAYTQFVATRADEWWYVTGTRDAPVPHRERLLFYRELVAVDSNGRLIADIVNGKQQTTPTDPGRFAAYYAEAKTLAPDAISVSHLSRLYVPRPADESTLPPGAAYADFNGVYRFVSARRTASGAFDGAVMLALDARHLMDFVVHINSGADDGDLTTLWPDYNGGDYAELFDDAGWTIVHPNLWWIRGDDASGQPVPPQTAQMSPEERSRHPFNVRLSGWADPNLPTIFDKGLSGQAGVSETGKHPDETATTYAPIPFAEGAYASNGVFGVLAIVANTAEFHESSTGVAASIDNERRQFQITMAVVILLSLGVLALVAFAIRRMLVRPLTQLTIVARELEEGKWDEERLTALRRRRFIDEITVLANVFTAMGHEVVRREQQLRTQIAELNIQIDSRRRQQQVDEITETDYFRNLRDTATRLRTRPQDSDSADGDPQ